MDAARLVVAVASALAVAGGALAGCGGGGATTVTVDRTVTAGAGTSTDELAGAPSADTEVVTTNGEQLQPTTRRRVGGASARDGSLTFRVTQIRRASRLEPKNEFYDPVVPRGGAIMWAATVTVRNDGTVSADPFCGGGGAVLVDQRKRNFEPDSEGALALSETCTSLAPGFRRTYVLPFFTPPNSRAKYLAVWDPNEADDFDGRKSFVDFDLP